MSEEPEKLAEGTLISHLLELRDRLVRALVAVLVMFIPCAIFSNEIFTFAAQPLIDKLPEDSTLIATSVISPFMTPFKLALFVALFSRCRTCSFRSGRSSRRGSTGTRSASRFRWCSPRSCCSTRARRSLTCSCSR